MHYIFLTSTGAELWLTYGVFPIEISYIELNSDNDKGIAAAELSIR